MSIPIIDPSALETTTQWRPVPGFPNHRVSNRGEVQGLRVRGQRRYGTWRRFWYTLPAQPLKRGHLLVQIYHDGKTYPRYVHRLVLEAFVGPCPAGMEACHFDGIPSNNRLENLRWDTHSANMQDRRRHPTHNRGEKNARAKLTPGRVLEIHRLLAEKVSQKEVARRFGISASAVSMIRSRRRWGHLEHDLRRAAELVEGLV